MSKTALWTKIHRSQVPMTPSLCLAPPLAKRVGQALDRWGGTRGLHPRSALGQVPAARGVGDTSCMQFVVSGRTGAGHLVTDSTDSPYSKKLNELGLVHDEPVEQVRDVDGGL